MIYEVRAYTFTAGDAPEAVEDFGRIIERRTAISPLVGFFISAIGGLNRILHIWEYENSAHREQARAEALAQPWWPPLKVDKILHQQTRIMRAAPFCPKPRAGAMGSVYEIRSDVIVTGKMRAISAAWENNLPDRERLSPLAGGVRQSCGRVRVRHLERVFTHLALQRPEPLGGSAKAGGKPPRLGE